MNNDEKLLDSFDAATRRAALERQARNLPAAPVRNAVNMHAHSFFSYNSRGYSPSHIALEARRAGLYAAGLCDFDVLDGLEEFLDAGLILGLRAAVHIETRAFVREYAQFEINSPGEPGVAYVMGAGFARVPEPGSAQAAALEQLKRRASARNAALVERINRSLPEFAIDYTKEVLPLSPGGCPTERHIVSAYIAGAERRFPEPDRCAALWADILKRPKNAVASLLADRPAMEEAVRTVLVKKGGIGYEPPTEKTFPPADEFFQWVLQCRAIPMAAWLDGTSKGEENLNELLECLGEKGVAAVNIIPDRNYNIADPKTREIKIKKLDELVSAAAAINMPLNIGTEMNKDGQPFFDDIAAPALAKYADLFLSGAKIMVGHTRLLRYAGYSYTGEEAAAEFGKDVAAKNRFFESVGALPPLNIQQAALLEEAGTQKALDIIRRSAADGNWRI